MRIEFVDNKFIVFLNKKMVSSIDFSNYADLESYFKGLFCKLSDEFDIDFCGSYDIDVYIDKYYGAIISVVKNNDYFEYCDIVDMKISISRFSNFVYKINSFCRDYGSYNVYLYDSDLYLEPIDVDFYDLGFLFEDCEVIYGKRASDVRLYGKNISDLLIK